MVDGYGVYTPLRLNVEPDIFRIMKNISKKCLTAAVLAGLLAAAGLASAQSTTTTTTSSTTSAGTISEFSPSVITVQSTTSATPVSYSYSKTTTYVDQNGNPVAMETVKSGVPVTIYYTQDGDKMVASKVVVQRTTTTSDSSAAPVTETKKTTTTTTSGQ
jgi:hypothetical protein